MCVCVCVCVCVCERVHVHACVCVHMCQYHCDTIHYHQVWLCITHVTNPLPEVFTSNIGYEAIDIFHHTSSIPLMEGRKEQQRPSVIYRCTVYMYASAEYM